MEDHRIHAGGGARVMATAETEAIWRARRPVRGLPAHTIHVWRASLDVAPPVAARLHGTLSADEAARAARFAFQRDRAHFVAARGLLRAILGRYLELPPGDLRFANNRYGKPAIASETAGQPIQFNLSHSHGVALFAVSRGGQLGVDIELVRTEPVCEQIAARFFAPGESSQLATVPLCQRQWAFFTCWTRKEAYIKARGDGLSRPLDSFEVSVRPGEPARLLCTYDDASDAERWSIVELAPGEGYVGALAAEGRDHTVLCWQYLDDD